MTLYYEEKNIHGEQKLQPLEAHVYKMEVIISKVCCTVT